MKRLMLIFGFIAMIAGMSSASRFIFAEKKQFDTVIYSNRAGETFCGRDTLNLQNGEYFRTENGKSKKVIINN